MNESEINDKLKEYARTSKNIQYSTKIFEKTEDTSKKTKIVLRELIKGENEKEKHVWAIILKYTIDDIPQEVIMGTLGNTNERKEKTVDIINFIENQLEENTNSETGYDGYERLCQYVQTLNIPFEFTGEGIDILANKSKKDTSILRTYYSDNQGKIQCKYDEEAVKIRTKDKQQQLFEEANRKKEIGKWKSRREKILKSFIQQDKKQAFTKGEKVTEFIRETEDDIEAQQNLVADYLLEAFTEEKTNSNPKLDLAIGYLKIKEKGIVIDIKRHVEKLEATYFKEIEEKKREVTFEEYKTIERFGDIKNFFELVKNGQDWNARLFALRLKKIDFGSIKTIVEKYDKKDTELLEYLDLKEKAINEMQTDSIEVDYEKYNTVKEMYEFLMHSSIREMTKRDDKRVISSIYEHIKREILESNFDEVAFYNSYAEKSNMYVCELPKVKKISEERPLSKLVQRINGSLENKDNQNQNEQAQQEGQEYDD